MRIASSTLVLAFAASLVASAETVCYRTAAQAAAQNGDEDRSGFRLDALSQDPLRPIQWATLRRCGHPEWPAIVVPAHLHPLATPESLPPSATPALSAPANTPPLVVAGSSVTITAAEDVVRLELQGTAQSAGHLGETIRVKLLGTGEERYLAGRVIAQGHLELVR